MAYTFAIDLLSAVKTGTPNLLGCSLSGVGVTFLSGNNVVIGTQQVVVVFLSASDVGISFNPIQVTVPTQSLSTFAVTSYPLSTVNVLGSVFRIPSLLNGQTFAITETGVGGYTTFAWLSTTNVNSLSVSTTNDVVSRNRARKRLLGYPA